MNEEWRPIHGFEEWYEVSDLGRVRSWFPTNSWRRSAGMRAAQPKVLKPRYSRYGYASVILGRHGVQVTRYIHHLVLEAFNGPCPDGYEALHENDEHGDNCLTNLRWGTHAENVRMRSKNGMDTHGETNGCAKLTDAHVQELRSGQVTTRELAGQLGMSERHLRDVRDGKYWRHV